MTLIPGGTGHIPASTTSDSQHRYGYLCRQASWSLLHDLIRSQQQPLVLNVFTKALTVCGYEEADSLNFHFQGRTWYDTTRYYVEGPT